VLITGAHFAIYLKAWKDLRSNRTHFQNVATLHFGSIKWPSFLGCYFANGKISHGVLPPYLVNFVFLSESH